MSKIAEQFGISSNSAELYEKYLIPGWFIDLTEITMGYAGNLHGKLLLDVATGTGIVPRVAAKKMGNSGKIIGVDINKAMLAIAARQNVPLTELQYADATKLPFDSAMFDIVTCQQGFQFFPDKEAAANEMYRVTKPGGRAIITTWSSLPENPAQEILVTMIEKYYSKSAAKSLYPPFSYTDKNSMRKLFRSIGFQTVLVNTREITCTFTNPRDFTVGMVGATPAAEVVRPDSPQYKDFSEDVADALRAKYANGRGITFPMHSTFIVSDK